MMIVLVFDPLAVLMLIAANWQMRQDKEESVQSDASSVFHRYAPTAPEPVDTEENPTKSSWSEVLFKKKTEPLPDEAKAVIHNFFHKDDVKITDNVKVDVATPDSIVQEVDKLQKPVEYDSLGRRITP
jgi:hypothetical protein